MKALRDSRDAATTAASAAEERAVAAERKAAFAIGGFDLADPVTKMFADQYKGEATSEAIAEAWTEAGFAPRDPAAPPADPGTPPADEPPAANLSHQIDSAFAGGVPAATPVGEDPMDIAYAAYHEARREGRTVEDAQELVVGAIAAGAIDELANGGGSRFNYNREEFHRRIG
jgi:hypothetical protein